MIDSTFMGANAVESRFRPPQERHEPLPSQFSELILVPGHATFKATVRELPPLDFRTASAADLDNLFYLQSFQKGEGTAYVEHILTGIELAANKPSAMLVFSGACSREKDGWSEAESYATIAESLCDELITETGDLKYKEVKDRIYIDPLALDSFQNVLGGLITYQQMTGGSSPENIDIVGWEFKRNRFEEHVQALNFPLEKVIYHGVNDPKDIGYARACEAKTVAAFRTDPYGIGGELGKKRRERNVNRIDQAREYAAMIGDTNPVLRTFVQTTMRPLPEHALFLRRPQWN